MALTTSTAVAATALKLTVVPAMKFAPVMVTTVLPTDGPRAGLTLVMAGAGAGSTGRAWRTMPVPSRARASSTRGGREGAYGVSIVMRRWWRVGGVGVDRE